LYRLDIPVAERAADKAAGRNRRWGPLYLRFRPHLDQLFELLFDKLKYGGSSTPFSSFSFTLFTNNLRIYVYDCHVHSARVGVWTFSGRGPAARELMEATFGKYAPRVEFCYSAAHCSRMQKPSTSFSLYPSHHMAYLMDGMNLMNTDKNPSAKDLTIIWGNVSTWTASRTLLIDDVSTIT
jgi:hypothetical protein